MIIGCGRIGSFLANELSRKGESVIVVDENENTFANLTNDFSGFTVVGDATQVEILKRAKVHRADVLLVLTNDDNINTMIAQVGKKVFNVPNTIARVFDPVRISLFKRLGIETICPTLLMINSLVQAVDEIAKKNS